MNSQNQSTGTPFQDPRVQSNPPGPATPPPPQEPPFIPYQKPTPPPPPPYYIQPKGYPPYPGMPYPKPKSKTKLATASLVLGAIALGLLLIAIFGDISVLGESGYHNSSNFLDLSFPISVCGLLALIFGLVSRSRFQSYPPNFPGRRNSLLGIIFGAVSLGFLLLIYLLAFSLVAYLLFLFTLTVG